MKALLLLRVLNSPLALARLVVVAGERQGETPLLEDAGNSVVDPSFLPCKAARESIIRDRQSKWSLMGPIGI